MMMKYLRYVLPLVCLMAMSPLAFSDQGAPPALGANTTMVAELPAVSANLIAEKQAVEPGQPFWVGVELKMASGWDTYWQNPGDAGFPTQIKWDLPSGFTSGPIEWPAPEKFTTDNMVGFGYTDHVLLLTQITPPKNISAQDIAIKADVSWLACNESCEPGNASLELSLPVVQSTPLDSSNAALFAKAKESLPQSAQVTADTSGDSIILKFNTGMSQISSVQFFPEKGEVIDYLAPQTVEMNKGGAELSLQRSPMGDALPKEIRGVLTFSDEQGAQHVLQVDSQLKSVATSVASELSGLWVALGLAIVGGMILNVMPCVMPVIALKIFSFVKMAGEKRSVIFKHGLVFTAGVIISFWILSGALLLLRFSGQSLGWGFQLQEPVFVAVLAGILFLLGLSLFGVFELGTSLMSVGQKGASSSRSPLVSSFMSGILATLVATPCTGPLLGPALGYAMTLPALKALMIFTAMGFGMSLPYLVFSAFPKLVRFLPKPGNWMVVFKHLMGFLMMGTVAWLVWVFSAQTGSMGTLFILLSLLTMSVGAWIFGRWGSPIHKRATRMLATTIAVAVIGFGGSWGLMAAKKFQDTETTQIAQDGVWETFSPEKVAELQAAGTPVFVDFTAKWCLICQANKVVLHSSAAGQLFKEYGVVPMVADWTKKDPVITKQLETLGRSGVPVYVLYPAKEGAAPIILPQTLTGSVLNEYVHKLKNAD